MEIVEKDITQITTCAWQTNSIVSCTLLFLNQNVECCMRCDAELKLPKKYNKYFEVSSEDLPDIGPSLENLSSLPTLASFNLYICPVETPHSLVKVDYFRKFLNYYIRVQFLHHYLNY